MVQKEDWLMEEELLSLDSLRKRGSPLNRNKLSSSELDEYMCKS